METPQKTNFMTGTYASGTGCSSVTSSPSSYHIVQHRLLRDAVAQCVLNCCNSHGLCSELQGCAVGTLRQTGRAACV